MSRLQEPKPYDNTGVHTACAQKVFVSWEKLFKIKYAKIVPHSVRFANVNMVKSQKCIDELIKTKHVYRDMDLHQILQGKSEAHTGCAH